MSNDTYVSCYKLHTVTTLYSLLTAHCSLLTAHCSLLTAHCSLLTAHCSLLPHTAHPSPNPHRAQNVITTFPFLPFSCTLSTISPCRSIWYPTTSLLIPCFATSRTSSARSFSLPCNDPTRVASLNMKSAYPSSTFDGVAGECPLQSVGPGGRRR
jgi:hypothetical protein